MSAANRKKVPKKLAAVHQKKTADTSVKGRGNWVVCILILIISTAIVYGPSLKNKWTNWDDVGYVLENPLVKSIDLKAIFSTYIMGNYHPATILTQAMEYQSFKDDAFGFHTISLILHLINTLLLFYLVFKLTRKLFPAFLCGLLFAIHPMHVESVSWVSAQKDLLYTLFYFASMIFYLQYRELPGKKHLSYLGILIMFLLSLISKAQAVTLPVIMLLIDWYQNRKISSRVILEKVPFFIMAFVFGTVAIIAQKASESIQEITLYSWYERLILACFAIVNYLTRFIAPVGLSAYYPYPVNSSGNAFPLVVYSAPVVIAIIAFLIYRLRTKHPYLVFGSLFFLVNIFLVLQLLPVGGAITADRYSYLSYTGLFFAFALVINTIWENKSDSFSKFKIPGMAAVSLWIIFLSVQSMERTKAWYSSEKLWMDVIAKYPRVPIAYNDLGSYYQKHDQLDLAKKNFDIALKLQPDFLQALINRSDLFRVQNKIDSAIIDGNHAVKLKPGDPDSHMNRGIAYSLAEKNDSALSDFSIVIKLQPHNARAYNNLGNLYMIREMPDSAIFYYNQALKYDTQFIDVLNNRGLAFLKIGRYTEALNDLTRAISNNPDNPNNYYFRMQANEKLGRYEQALNDALIVSKSGLSIPEDYLLQLRKSAGSR